MNTDTPTVLKKILSRKAEEVAQRKLEVGIDQLKKSVEIASPVRGFTHALRAKIAADQPAVIAEIKKASPSKGVIETFRSSGHSKKLSAGGCSLFVCTYRYRFFSGSG